MAVPPNGFDHRVRRQMEKFNSAHKIKARFGGRSRKGSQEYCRWCFADAKCADAFRERFGGERLKQQFSVELEQKVQLLLARGQIADLDLSQQIRKSVGRLALLWHIFNRGFAFGIPWGRFA
jgi:hypothetical protein